MLAEGVPAPTIEQASSQAGYPAPVLQLSDELNLKLMRKIRGAAGGGRGGRQRLAAAPGRGRRSTACSTSSAAPASSRARASTSTRTASAPACGRACATPSRRSRTRRRSRSRDLEERMLFIEAIETVKCLDEGVIESVADANIGSIIGHRLPGWTGGVLQYINGYDGTASPASSPARASSPRPTASASSRPPRWSRRPSAARSTRTRRRRSRSRPYRRRLTFLVRATRNVRRRGRRAHSGTTPRAQRRRPRRSP